MIVCLCHRISDRDIEREVHQGTRCFEVLQDDLMVASSCACCHDEAREVFDAACTRANLPQPAIAAAEAAELAGVL